MAEFDIKKVSFNTGDEGEYRGEGQSIKSVGQTKPTTRDFKKVLSKGRREGKEDIEANAKKKAPKLFAPMPKQDVQEEESQPLVGEKPTKDEEEEASSQESLVSLFDLSKDSHSKKEDPKQGKIAPKFPIEHVATSSKPARAESPSDLFKRISAHKREDDFNAEASMSTSAPVREVKETPQATRESSPIFLQRLIHLPIKYSSTCTDRSPSK